MADLPNCPNCNSGISHYAVKIGFKERWVQDYFECPVCKILLRVSPAYAWLVLFGTLLTAIAIALMFGVSWILFLPVVIVIWLIVTAIAGVYVRVIVPPKIEQYYSDDLSLIQRK